MSYTATSRMDGNETRVGKLEQGITGGKANLTWKVKNRLDRADYIMVRILGVI